MVDAPVVASLVTASTALAVALYSGVRADLSAAHERRYERRKGFLIAAQDAALGYRDALRSYGVALRDQAAAALGGPEPASFTIAVPTPIDLSVAAARGLLEVALSRLEDEDVARTLREWQAMAVQSLIDTKDLEAAAEQAAFDAANDRIAAAMRSRSGVLSRADRRAVRAEPDGATADPEGNAERG